jgi:hypothetical protein
MEATPSARKRHAPSSPSALFSPNLSSSIEATLTTANAILAQQDDTNGLKPLIVNLTKLLAELTAAYAANKPTEPSFEERERERSVVLIGLPESPQPTLSLRQTADIYSVSSLIDFVGAESVQAATYRMGQPSKDHPRLTKVVFHTRSMQRDFLAKSNKWLKEMKSSLDSDPSGSTTNETDYKFRLHFKNLIVRKSLSAEERERERILRDEARKRRDKGEKCWVYNGQIVNSRIPPPENR